MNAPSRTPDLPDYRVRRSARARRVSLKVTPWDGVVVVVPTGFDTRAIPALVAERRGWIERALASMAHTADATLPETIELAAIEQKTPVTYRNTAATGVRATERRDGRLVLSGAVDDQAACRSALRRWLARRGRAVLVPRLRALGAELGLRAQRVSVRGQKSRWGSCSARGDISLNYHLLFMPADAVDSALVHELCHIRHPHHGPAFWALVEACQPDYRRLHDVLDKGWRRVPGWALQR